MDYQRIYREFIEDRRRKEADLDGYSELHHIIPRHLGGEDGPDNLIRLTPEDHFFAHLLLAKWHDTMSAWGAVMVMHERATRKTIFWRKSRERYGWARRRFSEFCKTERLGDKNPNYRSEPVTLKRANGETTTRTRHEWFQSGIPHAALCGVLTGKSQSYRGWMLPDTDPINTGRSAAGRAKRIKTKYSWRHVDGRTAHLSPFDFAEQYGLRANDVTSVARGEHGIVDGWSIEGRKTGWPCGRATFRDEAIHELIYVDGRTLAGTQVKLIALTGLGQREVSAIIRGRRKSAGGWMLRATADSGYIPKGWHGKANVTQAIAA